MLKGFQGFFAVRGGGLDLSSASKPPHGLCLDGGLVLTVLRVPHALGLLDLRTRAGAWRSGPGKWT